MDVIQEPTEVISDKELIKLAENGGEQLTQELSSVATTEDYHSYSGGRGQCEPSLDSQIEEILKASAKFYKIQGIAVPHKLLVKKNGAKVAKNIKQKDPKFEDAKKLPVAAKVVLSTGLPVEVFFVYGLEDAWEASGLCFYNNRTIFIEANQDQKAIFQTLLHELLHYALDVFDKKNPDSFVEPFAQFLYGFLQQLVEFKPPQFKPLTKKARSRNA